MQYRKLKEGENARELAEQGIEVWTELYSNDMYWMSNLGRRLSFHGSEPTIRALRALPNKYPIFTPFERGSNKGQDEILVHRAVLISFEGYDPDYTRYICRHKNGNKHDPRLCNLEWGTREENWDDHIEHQKEETKSEMQLFTLPCPVTNKAYIIPEPLIIKGIQLAEKGVLGWKDICEMWDCTKQVAESIIYGKTKGWQHIPRDIEKLKKVLGREGEDNHNAKNSNEEIEEILRLYVENGLSSKQVAKHLGVTQGAAHNLLSGKTWKGIPRPKGFEYPRKNARSSNRVRGSAHGGTHLTEEVLIDMFDRVMKREFNSRKEIEKHLSLSKGATGAILLGRSWTQVPRPEGFEIALASLAQKKGRPHLKGKVSTYSAVNSMIKILRGKIEQLKGGAFKFKNDKDALFKAEDLVFVQKETKYKTVFLPLVVDFFWEYIAVHGWIYPEQTQTLDDAMHDIKDAKRYGGSKFLKAEFSSYWATPKGPQYFDKDRFTQILKYRMGLKKSKLYDFVVKGKEVKAYKTVDLSLYELRRGFIERQCLPSFFQPSLAYSIIRKWCPKGEVTYYDPSGGWGTRMLSFACARKGGKYICCEPATLTRNDLFSLGQQLEPYIETEVHEKGSEDLRLEKDSVDFIFTSPPYFDLEIYAKEDSQSLRKFPERDEWMKGFLKVTLENCFHALKPDHYAVFNVHSGMRAETLVFAKEVGFTLEKEEFLELQKMHYNSKEGEDNTRREPILIFKKP